MSIRQYLEQSVEIRKQIPEGMPKPKGFMFSCIEEMVLIHGREFKNQPLPKEYTKLPYKECFRNSFNMMIESGGNLIYCEGYAFSVIPTLHAWCVDKKGNVVDATWDFKDSHEYFGIPMNEKFVLRTMLKSRYYGVLDNWHDNYPLLRKFDKRLLYKKFYG